MTQSTAMLAAKEQMAAKRAQRSGSRRDGPTWYVLRGLWLWCGKGMRPLTTPMTVNGSISRWVTW